ncbi:response regulator transcription factor [Bacillus sp. 1P10SD]|uniref:response regulator transcription factor n=1 Tax=Bacillus sp. 1P10SD TaxID=3132265 RepID=UPI0039A6539C
MSIKLAIVDDQEIIREGLFDIFDEVEGIEVLGLAENGLKAVEICTEKQPDTVLMDINMPVMDGVEATKAIKEKWPHIRVIILTTFQEITYVREALQAGAEGYLLKAIEPTDLIAGVQLISHGGTLISKEIANLLIGKMNPDASSPQKAGNSYGLTERETDVLRALASGLTNAEIAAHLFLSVGTVKNYISNIYSKFEISDRLKLANRAREEGVI